MKLLVALFALTAVTGGQAAAISEAPSSEPKLKELLEKMSLFGLDAYVAVTKDLRRIRETEAARTVVEQLEEISEKLWDQVRELPPEIMEAMELVSRLRGGAREKAFSISFQWYERYHNEFLSVLEALAVYVDPVASKALWCVEWLKENVRPKVIEMHQARGRLLDQAIESWESKVSSYAKETQEIGEGLQVSLDKAAKQLRLGLETLSKHLKPYWIPFLKEYKKYEPALREWAEGPLFPPPKKD